MDKQARRWHKDVPGVSNDDVGKETDVSGEHFDELLFERLQQARRAFSHRRSFVHFVCDELVRTGMIPGPGRVRRYAAWGRNTAIAEDVREWYRQLAKRLDKPRASAVDDVPYILRQQAQSMVEQLWNLAKHEAEQRSGGGK